MTRKSGFHPGNRVRSASGTLQGNLPMKTCFQSRSFGSAKGGSIQNRTFTIIRCAKAWPHLLTVRKSGFHPGNRGSIPLGVTKDDLSFTDRSFLFGT